MTDEVPRLWRDEIEQVQSLLLTQVLKMSTIYLAILQLARWLYVHPRRSLSPGLALLKRWSVYGSRLLLRRGSWPLDLLHLLLLLLLVLLRLLLLQRLRSLYRQQLLTQLQKAWIRLRLAVVLHLCPFLAVSTR